jgi:protein-S-isoprenylcysteine O-methyltransferase Ste14
MDLKTLVIWLAILFGFSELVMTILKRSKRKNVKIKRDMGSLAAIYIIITVSLAAGFSFSHLRFLSLQSYLLLVAGLVLFFSGLLIRWISILQLKDAFTVDVVIHKDHELKTDGIYRLVRHPSYLGVMTILTGLAITMNSFISLGVVVLPVFLVILYRIHIEEGVLIEEFGDSYRKYMEQTRKIIPFIY